MNTLLLEYSRIPKTTSYVAEIKYGITDETLKESSFPVTLRAVTADSLEMVIEELHNCMKERPHKHVCIMQTPYQEKSVRIQKLFELSDSMRELILNDLPKAKLAFAPVTNWKGSSHEQST